MPRKPAKDKLPLDTIAQHMTAELQILNQSADHARDMLMSKVNFFLVLTTAIGGGLAYILTNAELRDYFRPSACVVIFILALMGLNTLRQGLDLSASVITYYRRAGRIRQWYADQAPELVPYFPFTLGDNMPRMSSSFINLRGAESILLLTNGVLCGVLAGLGVVLIDEYLIRAAVGTLLPLDYVIATVSGLMIFGLAWALQVRYVKKFMKDWDERQTRLGMFHFPNKIGTEEEFQKIMKGKK